MNGGRVQLVGIKVLLEIPISRAVVWLLVDPPILVRQRSGHLLVPKFLIELVLEPIFTFPMKRAAVMRILILRIPDARLIVEYIGVLDDRPQSWLEPGRPGGCG